MGVSLAISRDGKKVQVAEGTRGEQSKVKSDDGERLEGPHRWLWF